MYHIFAKITLSIGFFFCLHASALADHVIITGGPALRSWENLRTKNDQHDRWWANFIRASTLRISEIRTTQHSTAPIIWMVYQPSYVSRSGEDHKPYTQWIQKLAKDRNVKLIWFNHSQQLITAINSRPKGSIQSFDFFGHSNRYAFMFDYGNDILAASTALLHERDLNKISSAVFSRHAHCKSWGCYTGSSMSAVWKRSLGIPLIGAKGATNYTSVSNGILPICKKGWTQ